jgi:hypothetical protein
MLEGGLVARGSAIQQFGQIALQFGHPDASY